MRRPVSFQPAHPFATPSLSAATPLRAGVIASFASSTRPEAPTPPATPLPAGSFRVGPIQEPAAPPAAAVIIEEEIRISADLPLDPAPSRATTEAQPHGEPTACRAPSHAGTEPVSGIRTWEGPDGGTSGDIGRGPLGATERVRFFAPGSPELSHGL